MSLLDTFTILFQADTGSVEDGARRSENAVDGLLDSLRDTDAMAGRVGDTLKDYAKGALGAITAALGAKALVSGTIQKAADITALEQTAEALGEAIEEVDAFGRATAAAGGDAETARDALTDMAEKIGEALSDTESSAAKAFSALGVGLKDAEGNSKGAVTGMLDLAAAVEGMDKAQAVFKLKELGVSDNITLEMLLKGRKELERMMAAQKEQGVVTKETAEQARKLTEGMNRLRGALDTAGTGFMVTLIPAISKGVEWLTTLVDWAGEHSDFIVGFFAAIGTAVTLYYTPPMLKAAATTLAATWPIIAIGAAVVAMAALFALAYEDIMYFIEGNDSLIGQIFDKYPMVKSVVFGTIDAFKAMGVVVSAIWNTMITGFQQVIDFILAGVRQISQGIRTVASFFGIGSDAPAAEGENGEGTALTDAQSATAGIEAGRQAMTAANASPLNATTSNAISNSASSRRETNVQVGDITINTQATDAKGVAAEVGGELTGQIKQLESEHSSGVDR
ncbi:hypothetical protein NRB16_24455 [Pseudomonas sp. LJDD11]|uniref:phage tail tape measure protein n=1 Tax=Pseudomonas sp. LJDD11 TaxID=2931984 RepID=UPI00211CFCD9|nr:phage tail tape measure protein [Pseudomonas sp. LJDD11]MCQ9426676.1 hypothetical protein [Pseudomonas sp. LJDD11]